MVTKQLKIISTIENAWYGNLNETNKIELSKQWVKNISLFNDELKIMVKSTKNDEKDS